MQTKCRKLIFVVTVIILCLLVTGEHIESSWPVGLGYTRRPEAAALVIIVVFEQFRPHMLANLTTKINSRVSQLGDNLTFIIA